MAPIGILIVDDHPLFSTGFAHMARALRPDWTLHMAATTAEALSLLRHVSPQLALLDVGLPDDDGFVLLRLIAEQWPGLPAVLISGPRRCGDAGARARQRRRRLHRQDSHTGCNCRHARRGAARRPGIRRSHRGCRMPSLTSRQAEVLELLAEGCSNKEMRHRLGIAERTVRAHLTELFHLLGASSRMQAVIRGRELGLITE
ncbi:MAG: response regulator transcription factor [Rhodospirillales bacterium]